MKWSQLAVVCGLYHVLGGWKWRGIESLLKLTCKMSGFRSLKVTSGAQIVCAVKVGILHTAGWGPVWGVDITVWFSFTEEIYWPARLGEHDDRTGAALEGSFDSTNGDGLCGVTGQMRGAAQLLKHLPVEHGGLGFTGNLNKSKLQRCEAAWGGRGGGGRVLDTWKHTETWS